MRFRAHGPAVETSTTTGGAGRRELVALVLAIGLALSLFTIVAAVMYDAVRSDTPGLSENATQILTGWGGGIIGVVGSYLGYRGGENAERNRAAAPPAEVDERE